ncbi:MAG: hypothetical protein JXJ04_25165 [Spirochaetales bacterium]|nr:hypothetical protein [Spirochaetales bacterium]
MVKEYEEIVLNFNNSRGNSIYSIYSFIKGKRPLVIITPQYEKTTKNNLIPMLYLINNGFNVFRYDNTFHKGNSYGNFEQFTLGSSLDDLEAVSRFIKNDERINTDYGVALLGISISSRTAFKFLSGHHNYYDIFLSLVGVVDMQSTLKAITHIDLVQETIDNPRKKWGLRKVINYEIDYDNFLKNCIGENYHNLQSTKNDVDKIKTNTYLLAAEQDPWINFEDCTIPFRDNSTILKEVYKIPHADHLLYKNPEAVKNAINKIVKILSRCFYSQEIPVDEINSPSESDLIRVHKLECKKKRKYQMVSCL